jgi:hypothetical protein
MTKPKTFIDRVGDYLIGLGATEAIEPLRAATSYSRGFILKTPLGDLCVTPMQQTIKRRKYNTVFMQFDDVQRALKVDGSINRFTGKSNIHFHETHTDDWCMENFTARVNWIMERK